MNFIDEEDVVLFQVGQQGCQVFRFFQHGAAGLAQIDTEFMGDDVRQRRLAQSGRAKQQHMVQRLLAHFGGTDKDLELLAHLELANVLVKQFGPQRALQRLLIG